MNGCKKVSDSVNDICLVVVIFLTFINSMNPFPRQDIILVAVVREVSVSIPAREDAKTFPDVVYLLTTSVSAGLSKDSYSILLKTR